MLRYKLFSVIYTLFFLYTTLFCGYIPLSSHTNSVDNVWMLFGATGFKATGAGTGSNAGTFTIISGTPYSVVDETLDDNFVDGFVQGGGNLGHVKVLSPYTYVDVRIDTNTTGVVYDENETDRTAYIALEAGAAPLFALRYKETLEGKTVEFSINRDGSTARYATISYKNTYFDPAIGRVIEGVPGIEGSELIKIEDAVDYNLSNNPNNPVFYERSEHYDKDLTKNQNIRVYDYDAEEKKWNLFDSANTDSANDFLELQKGRAYWARIDTGDANTTAGLVLGNDTISAVEYNVSAGLALGWNLLAFEDVYSDVRVASTGLVVTLSGSSGTFTISDSSGIHEVDIVVAGNDENISKTFNTTIIEAKKNGELPDTLDAKAFSTATVNQIIILSNRSFKLSDTIDDVLRATATLTGARPIDPTTQNVFENDVVDIDTYGVRSVYAEYALIVEPLIGTGTAQGIGSSKLHIKSTSSSATDTKFDLKSSVSLTASDIDAQSDMSAQVLDIHNDDSNDTILISSVNPFYIRDYTFTRVFSYRDTNISSTIKIQGVNSNDYTVTLDATDDTASDAASEIDSTTDIGAAVDEYGNIVIVTSAEDSSEFDIIEDIQSDHLENNSSVSNMAKGAIKGVYSINYLVKRDMQNKIILDIDAINDDSNDTVLFNINGNGVNAAYSIENNAYDPLDSASVLSYFVEVSSLLSEQSKSQFLDVSVDHNFSYSGDIAADINAAVIIMYATDLESVIIVADENDSSGSADIVDVNGVIDISLLASLTPNLTQDLKFNAIYSPNYATDGPLYKMRSAGYEARAMVSGTRNLQTSDMAWSSVDLTRKQSELFSSQEYDLFDIDYSLGYWVYLADVTPLDTPSHSSTTINPVYTHHFNNYSSTSYNHISSSLTVALDGMDDYDDQESAHVMAYLAGSNIELAKSIGSSVYTGKISSYEVEGMHSGGKYELFLNISDGIGYNLKGFDTGKVIDFKKPNAAGIDISNPSSVTIFSSSSDVASYYIFKGGIPEENLESSNEFIVKLSVAEATNYPLCGHLDKLSYGSDPYTISIFAMDGTGSLDGGNASDINATQYVPMLKSSIVLEDSNLDENVSVPSLVYFGTAFDASCQESQAPTQDYGMWLTSLVSGSIVKMAFEPKSAGITPLSVYLIDTNSSKSAKITYNSNYVGERVYIEIEDSVFEFKLPSDAVISGGYGDVIGNAIELDNGGGNLQDGQNL